MISIPLPTNLFELLSGSYAEGEWFRVRTIYWNLGVNHEASFAASVGDISLEENVNRAALVSMETHTKSILKDVSPETSNITLIQELLENLKSTVRIFEHQLLKI